MTEPIVLRYAIVDDHTMFRKGIIKFLEEFTDLQLVFEAGRGTSFLEMLRLAEEKPDVCLLDINLGNDMNGYDVAAVIKQEFPQIKMLAVSMYDSEFSVLRMIQNGVHGYILKSEEPQELHRAIFEVYHKGMYSSDIASARMIFQSNREQMQALASINEKEMEFIRLNCSELSYKEIAEKMNIKVRTIEYYRNSVFEKTGIQSRISLALFAVKAGIAGK